MHEELAIHAIIKELIERPGQSRFSLASHLQVAPTVLEDELRELADQGIVVPAEVPGDEEPVYWASEEAASPAQVTAATALRHRE